MTTRSGLRQAGDLRVVVAHDYGGCGAQQADGHEAAARKLRETVQNIEAQIIKVPTGSQDYYPAMYGGVGYIKMSPAGITRVGVPVDLADFNSRIVLAYTGVPRNSGINNWEK
jgi:D-glycero-alpha-D-manno-heptose-7-phosphate kinase